MYSSKDFVLLDDRLVNINAISCIDMQEAGQLKLQVYFDGIQAEVTGLRAIDLLLLLKPSALEGKNLRWAKNAWMLHNFVAHPVMQLLALCKLPKLGLWLHDSTVPRPFGAKK